MSMRTTAPPGAPGEPPPGPAYPWRLFVGMLAAILLGSVVLALLLGLNPLTLQRLAPPAQPTAVSSAPAQATRAPTALATAVPTAAPAPTSVATPAQAQATSAPIATAQAPAPTAEATTSAPSQPSTGAPAVPTNAPAAQVEPTPIQAQVSPELATAILQAYNNYWSVRVRAMGDPRDPNIDLDSVMAGDELAAAKKTLAEYRDDGEAYRTTVHHQIWITRATESDAELVDRFTAETLKLDPQTKEPVESQPVVEQLTGDFVLRPIEGVWKVVGRSQGD